MSFDATLLGLGLVLVLAVGTQLAAARLGLPAIVLLLPAGVLAGVATDDVHPDVLLGHLYQPFVSLAVGVILFEAGLRLSFGDVDRALRRVVGRLVSVAAIVTWAGVTAAVALLFDGLGARVPLLLGAVLVVSGPTVVGSLIAYVRPSRRVRSVLTWEGVLIDPIGALLSVLVLHTALSADAGGGAWHPGEMLLSVLAGALVGAAGAVVLRVLVEETQRTAPRQTVPAVLMVVVAAVVAADLLRDDAGFVAATVMGMALANQRRIDLGSTLVFQATLVQMLIGVLFITIAASVSLADLGDVLPGALGLVAAMVLVIRPLAVAAATARSDLTWRERAFLAAVAPRGVVAGATASAFGLALAADGVAGADRILPIAFVAIFGTVVVYGLAAAPVARALGVAGHRATLVLVVGGSAPARVVALGLARAGVAVRVLAAGAADQAAARAAGLEADRAHWWEDAVQREVELEEVTDALVLTPDDHFNALAAADLRADLGHGHVHSVAPEPHGDGRAPPGRRSTLGGGLSYGELMRRIDEGAEVVDHPDAGAAALPLLAIGDDGTIGPPDGAGRVLALVDGDPRAGDPAVSAAARPAG